MDESKVDPNSIRLLFSSLPGYWPRIAPKRAYNWTGYRIHFLSFPSALEYVCKIAYEALSEFGRLARAFRLSLPWLVEFCRIEHGIWR